jgi:hypothetical protein
METQNNYIVEIILLVGVLHEHRVIIPFADAIIKPATTSSPGEGNLTGDISSVQIFFLFYPLSGPHERREGGANKHEVNNGRFGTTIALLKGVELDSQV